MSDSHQSTTLIIIEELKSEPKPEREQDQPSDNAKRCRFHITGGTDLIFCIIWLGMVFVSIVLAHDAYQSSLTQLGTFDFRIPQEYNVNINGLKFQEVINDVAETQDKNAKALQSSIRNSSTTLLNLNLFAAVLSFVGFLTQFNLYRRTKTISKLAGTEKTHLSAQQGNIQANDET